MEKTGGYVGARVVLAGINPATTAVVFVIIGMPYWIPLALWTGIVAQFVPTIGTYILDRAPGDHRPTQPGPDEPRISAEAVEVDPAVSVGAVLLGAALFGVAGAFLAVPVIAMLLALLNIYGHRYELLPEISERIDAKTARPKPPGSRRHRTPAVDAVADSPGPADGVDRVRGDQAVVPTQRSGGARRRGRFWPVRGVAGYGDDDAAVTKGGLP